MHRLQPILALWVFLLLPFLLQAREHCSSHQSKGFTLHDLQGWYILQGASVGGPQLQSSAGVFLIKFREDGTGIVRSGTIRTFIGSPPATTSVLTTPLSAIPPAVGTIKLNLNPNGTAELLFYGIPTANDVTTLSAVFEKENKKVQGGFAIRTGVIGPSADSPFANDVNTFTFKRQRR